MPNDNQNNRRRFGNPYDNQQKLLDSEGRIAPRDLEVEEAVLGA